MSSHRFEDVENSGIGNDDLERGRRRLQRVRMKNVEYEPVLELIRGDLEKAGYSRSDLWVLPSDEKEFDDICIKGCWLRIKKALELIKKRQDDGREDLVDLVSQVRRELGKLGRENISPADKHDIEEKLRDALGATREESVS
ncbi:MAG: hypothetical protein U5L75_02805 [Candidatus Campbellbacteria bacterium]|nr:hypothetical protein [Candidatus Campbellbacteria bacterium]